MSDLVNELATHTGLSLELVEKGLGVLLSFLKKELGEENFNKLKSYLPQPSPLTSRYESEPAPAPEEPAPSHGGLLGMITGLADKLLHSKAGQGIDLLAALSKLGFKPEQIESFLPKAIDLIKNYLPPELVEKLMAALPLINKFLEGKAKQGA